MKVREIIKLKKKDIVIPDYIMRPLEDENDEDIINLSDSINKSGMINEIDVRLIDGRYELMAGARRFVATKEDEILAKVFEDISDLDAMVLGLTENLQRKNPDINQRDSYIYKVWKKGKEEGVFKYLKDLAKKICLSERMLSTIIYAGELKERVDLPEIQRATSGDLDRTKCLDGHLDIRIDLLRRQQNNQINSLELENIAKDIKSEMENGTTKDIIVKSLELTGIVISNTAKKYFSSHEVVSSSGTTRTDSIDISAPECVKICKISDRMFKEVLGVYKISTEDIRTKLEKNEISVENAKIVMQFESPERREQIIKEIKTSDDVHDWDKRTIIDTRLKQQDELNKTGNVESKTRFDIEGEKKFEKEMNKDKIHDQNYLDRYQRMSSYVLETLRSFNPKNLKTDDVKKKATLIFRSHYELLYDILVDIGEIKEIRPGEADLNIKRLESVKIVNEM